MRATLLSRRDALRAMSAGVGMAAAVDFSAHRSLASPVLSHPTLCVRDEFATLKAAIVHDACNAQDLEPEQLVHRMDVESLRDHPESGPVSRHAIVEQVAAFHELLLAFGVELLGPIPVDDAPSQLFTRDPCFVIGQTLFVGRMRDTMRRQEAAGLDDVRQELVPVVDLIEDEEPPDDPTGPPNHAATVIEGGDVIVLKRSRLVLVGTNRHTNEAGFQRLADQFAESETRVVRIPHRALHLDCTLAPLPNGDALYQQATLPESSLPLLKPHFKRLTPLDPEEAACHLAANLLWMNPTHVVSSPHARKTNARLRSLGYKVHPIEFEHVKRMWGSFRCVTCPISRA